jgi:hypothetical protein
LNVYLSFFFKEDNYENISSDEDMMEPSELTVSLNLFIEKLIQPNISFNPIYYINRFPENTEKKIKSIFKTYFHYVLLNYPLQIKEI